MTKTVYKQKSFSLSKLRIQTGNTKNQYIKGDCLKRGGLDSLQIYGESWQKRRGCF